MVGPFKRSKDKKTHLLVAVDKFTKWVEAEPVSKCDAAMAVQFIKKVIFHFGFPRSIITDNGTNLSKGAMEEFYQREHIQLDVSAVAHPQSNGQAERANQEILKGINVGERSRNSKNFLRFTEINLWSQLATRGECIYIPL